MRQNSKKDTILLRVLELRTSVVPKCSEVIGLDLSY